MTQQASVVEKPLIHEARYRVRFDEAGPDGRLRTSGLMRYAQDVAWQHSTALGFGRAWYLERGLTWLVRSAELEVLAAIPMGVEVVSQTRVVGQKRVWARRRGEFHGPDGALVAWVHTDWVMIDARGALTRIPDVFGEAFRIPEATGQINRVALPPTPDEAAVRSFAVRPHELDPMDHVNNAVYLDWLEEAVLGASPDGAGDIAALPRRYRLEYAAAADAGMELRDAAWRGAGGAWSYRLECVDGPELFRAFMNRPGGSA
ncbi:MAG TPA: acyl-ACP thioesterase domain-containing protein [Candidatus Limnocylindrales bacterium]|nr:acyl-ACP thioesterase domain-containing protein [Candidatus Limnocylindrales bacterium]